MLRFRGSAVSGRPPLEGIDHLHAQLADRQLSHWHRLQKHVFNAINLHACMVRCQFTELDVSQATEETCTGSISANPRTRVPGTMNADLSRVG